MAELPALKEFTDTQRQIYGDALEIYQAYQATRSRLRHFQGGMHWKRIRGREYLYRYRDRRGHGESLGPRSETTARFYDDFTRQRAEITALLQTQRLRLQEQARFCRAASLNLVPTAAAKILRRLELHEPGRNFLVVGATALYAYQFAAGVRLEGGKPQGLSVDAGRGLTLVANSQLSSDPLLQLLRRADRSFAPLAGEGFRAANRDGFLVQVLPSGLRPSGKPRAVTVPGAREPLPPDAGSLQYLTVSPKLSQVVIGRDGGPATLTAPDPRAFALHQLWWSQQPDRVEGLRTRDRGQALTLAALVLGFLPQYDFSSSELEMFPPELSLEAEESNEELIEAENIS